MMGRVFDWEEEWEWEILKKREEELDRLEFEIPVENFINNKEKEFFNSSFNEIIYKNPAFTIQDMERYHYLSEEMD